MRRGTLAYAFRRRRVYNLEASGVIKNGEGASGAHSDIAHPEVAHAFWAAVLPRRVRPRRSGDTQFLGRTLGSSRFATRVPRARDDWPGMRQRDPRQADRAIAAC